MVLAGLGVASTDGTELGVHGGHGEPVGKERRAGSKWAEEWGEQGDVGARLSCKGEEGKGAPKRCVLASAARRHGGRVCGGR